MGHTFTGLTFEQLRDDVARGTIVHESTEAHGIRFIIVRGFGAPAAYLGVPKSHAVAYRDPDWEDTPIVCHGGLAFSGTEVRVLRELDPDAYWYGWDYGHCEDRLFFHNFPGTHGWTVEEIIADSQKSIQSLVKWMKEAEQAKQQVPAKVLTNCTTVKFHEGRKFRED